jgi:hypothetical protein
MTAPSPALLPAGRTLAGWWRQLAPWQPRGVWVGQLLLHRVEALTRLNRNCPLDPFTRLVLHALTLEAETTPRRLEGRLHLGPQVVLQVLRQLERAGLARAAADSWAATDLGRRAQEQGTFPRPAEERRTFAFVEGEGSAVAAHFLNLAAAAGGTAYTPGEGWRFDGGLLAECIRRPAEWKQRHGFPADVEEFLHLNGPVPEGTPPPEMWQRVVVDRPERFPTVLVRTGAEPAAERLLGFAVRTEGWLLQAGKPAFELAADWSEVFPDLAHEPPADAWRQAWRGWCQPRSLPAAEVVACTLMLHDCQLRVGAPARLVERLRAARSDIFRGEAWVLAGSGRLRRAAVLELLEGHAAAK